MFDYFPDKGFYIFFPPFKVKPVTEWRIEPIRIPVCFRHGVVCTNVIKLLTIRAAEFRIFAKAAILRRKRELQQLTIKPAVRLL